jgi:hypothetical protein
MSVKVVVNTSVFTLFSGLLHVAISGFTSFVPSAAFISSFFSTTFLIGVLTSWCLLCSEPFMLSPCCHVFGESRPEIMLIEAFDEPY